jgi:hypothetical protein
LYKFLLDLEEGDTVSAIIFVCKYGTLIDDHYKKLVHFYYRLFQKVIRSNVLLVITDAQLNDAKWLRQKKGIEAVQQTLGNTCCTLGEVLDIPNPNYFPIDCLGEGKDLETAWRTREIIFSRAFQLPGCTCKDFVFIKPLSIMELHLVRRLLRNLLNNLQFLELLCGEAKAHLLISLGYQGLKDWRVSTTDKEFAKFNPYLPSFFIPVFFPYLSRVCCSEFRECGT